MLDVTADDSRLDLVAGGFDAGIHYGEFIQKDMIAVRVSKDHRAAIVGSPEYFESSPNRNRSEISYIIGVSTSVTVALASIDGSSTKASNR